MRRRTSGSTREATCVSSRKVIRHGHSSDDASAETAKETTRNGKYTYVEYARYADEDAEWSAARTLSRNPTDPSSHTQGESEELLLLLELVSKSDVLVENFRPGTLEAWGLGWNVLSAANPGLVMLRVSGYGQTGPYRRRPGFAHIAHAIGGLSYLAGFPGETPVVPGTAPLGDYMSSLYGVIGVMLALRHKARTGLGQVIDVGIYEAVFRQLDELAPAYGLFGTIRERPGSVRSTPPPSKSSQQTTRLSGSRSS